MTTVRPPFVGATDRQPAVERARAAQARREFPETGPILTPEDVSAMADAARANIARSAR